LSGVERIDVTKQYVHCR